MILRSAFWLAVGFLVVAPHGTDFGALASQTRDQMTVAGMQMAQQLIGNHILAAPPLTKAVASVVLDKFASSSSTPSAALPMQVSPAAPIVFPRPRPIAMG